MTESLSPDERSEWTALLDDVLDAHPSVGDDAVDAAEWCLADAVNAQRPWARLREREYVRAGLRKALNDRSKVRDTVLLPFGEAKAKTTTRITAKRPRPDGTFDHQLSLLSEASWSEVEAYLDLIESQLTAGRVNRSKAKRLLSLRELHPNTYGPSEACALLGVSVDDYLTETAS